MVFRILVSVIFIFTTTSFAGSPVTEKTAKKPQSKTEKADDSCFTEYSHSASECNDSAGDDEAAFTSCLANVKKALILCCKNRGGSAKCDENAK